MLKEYQQEIQIGVLYAIKADDSGTEQLRPSLEVIGGTVDVYGAQQQPDTPPAGMFLTRTSFTGIIPFAVIPNFFYVAQNSGSTTSLVLSGVKAYEVI